MQPDKKGDFYVAVIEKPGRPAIEVIAEIVPEVVRDFPLAEVDALGRGVGEARRAHLGAAAAFDRRDLRAGDRGARGRAVRGRRHRGRRRPRTAIASWRPAPIRVRRFDDYVAKLEKAKVVLDPERRKEIILADAKNLAFAQGFELVEDEGLLTRSPAWSNGRWC